MVEKTLSHYRIVEKLGEGGMGVVWKALDTQLDREVAIKVLPETFSSDAERVARFEREAKLLASLNHRNIAAIYGLDEDNTSTGSVRFLVMELVEGEDLSRKLASGPLPVDESIDLCHQLARALEAAHEKGVLHRDLKPANVQVTPEGRIKVLDFGLAKAFEVEGESGDPGASPTLTSAGTRAGMILGTAAYMSPEQARGKTLDKRTDIWSFGCVLYECLTGKAAFRGETISDTLASILKSEANYALLPERTPPRVRELLQRCFEKDGRNRLRDIGDARLELQRSIAGHESLSGAMPAAVEPQSTPARRRLLPAVTAAVIVGAALGAGAWALLGGRGEASHAGFSQVARFSIQIPEEQIVGAWSLSPDGGSLVYTASLRSADDPDDATGAAYLRSFDSTEPVKIDGTAGITRFAFSPDGRWIAARVPVSPKATKYRLVKLRVDGSAPPVTVQELPDTWNGPFGWLPDGDILMGQPDPLAVIRVASDGGGAAEPIELVNEDFEGLFQPGFSPSCILPDGKHVFGDITHYGDSWDTHVGLVNLETGRTRLVIKNGGQAKWSPTGHLLFTRGETLIAVPFDPLSLETTGSQVAVTDGLFAQTVYNAGFDVSQHGTLLHYPGGLVGVDRRLMFIDIGTQEITGAWSDDRRAFENNVSVSPGGERIAVTQINADRYYEIWTSEMDRPRLTLLVREPGLDCTPGPWHPDGNQVLYACQSLTNATSYLRSVEGSDPPRKLVEVSAVLSEIYYPAYRPFTPDGSRLILTHLVQGEASLKSLLLSEPEAVPELLLEGASSGSLSADGRFLVYSSDASGRNELYLRRIDADLKLGREVPVTSDGADYGWFGSRPGEPLKIRYNSSRRIYEVIVTDGDRIRLSEPRLLGDMSEVNSKLRGGWWDVGDGRALAPVQGEGEDTPQEMTVIVNWQRELERRLRAER
jgi:hypothetical protein